MGVKAISAKKVYPISICILVLIKLNYAVSHGSHINYMF